jgi:anti-sigma B factor antagonist
MQGARTERASRVAGTTSGPPPGSRPGGRTSPACRSRARHTAVGPRRTHDERRDTAGRGPPGAPGALPGEIDAELGPDLLEAAEDALTSGRPLQVDAHHVTFMDSTGLAFLARLASRSKARRVTLIRPPAVVKFLIETTNIVQLLDVVDEEPGLTAPDDDGPQPA